MLNLTNLFNLLEERGKTAELSKKTGISSGNICDWKSGRSKPSAETLVKISEALECSVDYLLGRANNPNIEIEPIKIYRFPEYNQEVAAGVGRLGKDSNYYMSEYIVDSIPDNAVYSMKIVGESMNDEKTNNLIHTGSIILIDPQFAEYELDDKVVIANFKGKIICKRYINKGKYILFQSDNSDYESENRKSSDDPDCKVLGIVLGVIEDKKFITVK